MVQDKKTYAPALKFARLNLLYAELLPLVPQYKDFLEQLIKQATLQPNQKVLDIGCGPGVLLRMLKTSHPTVEAFGLDIDAGMLQIAQDKSKKESLAISYIQGSSTDLPFSDTSFDHVFASLFFHHLPMIEKQKTILEIYRVLKDSGHVHILDFGRPKNFFAKIGFVALQLFDGIDNVRPHGKDKFENLLCLSPLPSYPLDQSFQYASRNAVYVSADQVTRELGRLLSERVG